MDAIGPYMVAGYCNGVEIGKEQGLTSETYPNALNQLEEQVTTFFEGTEESMGEELVKEAKTVYRVACAAGMWDSCTHDNLEFLSGWTDLLAETMADADTPQLPDEDEDEEEPDSGSYTVV